MTKESNGTFGAVEVPALNALNARLRDDFVDDCVSGIARWNREVSNRRIDFEITLPHVAFNRAIGEFFELSVDPNGVVLSAAEFADRRSRWLPGGDDAAFIESLMVPTTEPGAFATWIAPPKKGIQNKPSDFEYVKLP